MIKQDNDGNTLKISPKGQITLLLVTQPNKARNLGTIVNGDYVKHDDESQIFRKLNAWSINYEIFKLAKSITIKTKTKTYTIDPSEIDVAILHFINAGMERKVYIPLGRWITTSN